MNRLRSKKNALNNLKHLLCTPHLRAEFPERIVRTTRGFTVPFFSVIFILEKGEEGREGKNLGKVGMNGLHIFWEILKRFMSKKSSFIEMK